MATTPKTKKTVSSTTKAKGVVASKKRSLSNKQWSIIGVVGALVLSVAGYFSYQYYQDLSPHAASKSWHVIRSAYIGQTLSTGDAIPSQKGFDGSNNTVAQAGGTYRFCTFTSGTGKFHFYGWDFSPVQKLTVNSKSVVQHCDSFKNSHYGRSNGVGISVDSGKIFFGGVTFEQYK